MTMAKGKNQKKKQMARSAGIPINKRSALSSQNWKNTDGPVRKFTDRSDLGLDGSYRGHAERSTWFQSLKDPVNVVGCRIPDPVTAPSGTIQCVQRITATATAAGDAGLNVTVGDLTSAGTQPLTSIAAGTITWGTAAAKTYAAQVTAVASLARIVSAGLFVNLQCSTSNDQGRILVNLVLPASNVQRTSPGLTWPETVPAVNTNQILNSPYLNEIPARQRYAQVVWIPLDNNALTYTSTGTAGAYGFFQIVLTGLSSGCPVEFLLVENYEYIPKPLTTVGAQALTGVAPSYSDPLEVATVSNALSENPRLAVDQPERNVAEASPVQALRQGLATHAPKAAGFLMNFLKGMGKFGQGAYKFGQKVAPVVGPMVMRMLG